MVGQNNAGNGNQKPGEAGGCITHVFDSLL